jgi:hypothetical protein
MSGVVDHSKATTIFVLGLLSILFCQILGPVAWMMGNTYKNECLAEAVEMEGLGSAGRILGMVGTGLLALNLLLLIVLVPLYFLIIAASVAGNL